MFSIFGLGLLIMIVNYALGLGAIYLFDRRWRLEADSQPLAAPAVRNWFLGALAALAAWTALSLALLRQPQTATVRLAALHYDVGAPPWRAVEKFIELTRQAAQDGAQIIIWPEVAIEGDPQTTDTPNIAS